MSRLNTIDKAVKYLGVEFSDSGLSVDQMKHAVREAVLKVRTDTQQKIKVSSNGNIKPRLSWKVSRLIGLAAKLEACSILATISANYFSFGSNDKRVDKSKVLDQWLRLKNEISAEYKAAFDQFCPVSNHREQKGVIANLSVSPVVYEQGGIHE